MVESRRPGCCFETTRPTTHAEPNTDRRRGSLRVTNMPGAVVAPDLRAVNATLPYVLHSLNRA